MVDVEGQFVREEIYVQILSMNDKKGAPILIAHFSGQPLKQIYMAHSEFA